MPARPSCVAPKLSEYEQNRRQFTPEQLLPYDGQWVAFTLDGRRIVASAANLLQLDERVRAAGDAVSNVGLEYIALDDFQGSEAEVV